MDTEQGQDLANQGIQQFRIERGARVVGTDGSLGAVEQIVVDRETGKLQRLVIRDERGSTFELPADRIEHASGDEVHLSIGRADLDVEPGLARPYTPEQYVPVDQGSVVPPSQVAHMGADAPVLTDMESDAVEIAAPTPGAAEHSETGLAEGAELDDSDLLDIEDQTTVILGTPDGATAEDAAMLGATPEAAEAARSAPERELPYDEEMMLGERGSVLGLATAGVLMGAAVGGLAYVMIRRRRSAPLSLESAQQQLNDLRGTAVSSWSALRGQIMAAMVALPALWRLGRERVTSSTPALRRETAARAAAATSALPSPSAIRDAVIASAAALPARGQQVAQQLAQPLASAQKQIQRRQVSAAKTTAAAAAAASAQAEKSRRAAARNARLMRRRARWFRRGIYMGVIGGLLYAPTPGSELRSRIASALGRVPGLSDLMSQSASSTASTSPVGSTGPRPRGNGLTERTTPGASGMRTPPLGETSEEPLESPLTSADMPDEVAGTTGV